MADVVNLHGHHEAGRPVRRHVQGGILRLTLDNPPANALSLVVLEALMAELDRAADDADVRVVVIGHMGKLFSSGHDLKEITAHRSDADGGRAFFERIMRLCADLMLRIAGLSKPVIAEVDGLATAAGCQLVASCDLAVCSDTSTFCTPGVHIGLFCSTPMVAVSRAASRKQAMEMLLTGETIDAPTAKDFGLVNRVVPKQYLAQVVDKYAAVIASKSPLVIALGKQAFYRTIDMPVDEAYAQAAAVMVDNLMRRDAQEGIAAFLDKRHAVWTGE